MGKLFGTDGIRGVANIELDARLAYSVGEAAATVLRPEAGRRCLVVVGMDTRASSDMLAAALTAGLCSAGADVIQLGVAPTPAIAWLTVKLGADAGVVISASHNPFEYNGIKIFNSQGYKLSDELEAEVEDIILNGAPSLKRTGADIGIVRKRAEYGLDDYISYLASMREGDYGNVRILIDCANGASVSTVRGLFERLGADFELMSCEPDGVNINAGCGSTDTEALRRRVAAERFDLGFAFDGDADRCIAVDGEGNEVDGDRLMAICAVRMKGRGELKGGGIIGTIMSNMGLGEFVRARGIELRSAAVGDRNVLELMQKTYCNLGGEQSGHVIFLDDSTTGDGQLAAVKLLNAVAAAGRPLSELAGEIPYYPQVLIGIEVSGGNEIKEKTLADRRVLDAIEEAEKALDGRVVVRPSGTESLIRVMVEAKDGKSAQLVAEKLAKLIKTVAFIQ